MDTTTVEAVKNEIKQAQQLASDYFNEIQKVKTLDKLGPEPEEFELWCYWKYKETQLKMSIADNMGESPDLQQIAKCLISYGPDLSWAISQQQLISMQLKKVKDARESWYNEKHLQALRAFKEQGNSAPAVKTINAWIEKNHRDEWAQWEEEIDNLFRKECVLEKHVSIWMKMDKVFSSLIYDMNTEYWRSYKKLEPNNSREIPRQLLDRYEDDVYTEVLNKGMK